MRNSKRLASLCSVLALGAAEAAVASPPTGWPQWGRDSRHTSAAAVPGQPLHAVLADFTYDPFVAAEIAESGDDLLVHFQSPLVEGNDVYMESKSGEYVSCDPPGSAEPFPCGPDAWDRQTWSVTKYTWIGGALVTVWSFPSDWKPEPDAGALGGFEPVFQPALAGDFLFVPGFAGTVHRVSKASGRELARINPFPNLNPFRYVAGGLAADADGCVIYEALELDPAEPWGADAVGSWIVRVLPDDTVAKVPIPPSSWALLDQRTSAAASSPAPSALGPPRRPPCRHSRPAVPRGPR